MFSTVNSDLLSRVHFQSKMFKVKLLLKLSKKFFEVKLNNEIYVTSMHHIKTEIISKLNKNQNMLLCQDKGRGTVIMGRNGYTSKCLNILEWEQIGKKPN